MIEIFAVSYNAQPSAADLRAAFGEDGGTLGRGPDNRLVLPDPARHVSRTQGRIRFDGARYWIANVSDANPLFVNEEEVESGHERPIAPGDELRVGLYLLRVQEAAGPAFEDQPLVTRPSEVTRRAVPAAAAGHGSLDSLLGGIAPAATPSPFDDILGGAVPIAPAPPPAASAPPPSKPASDLIEELGRLASAPPPPAIDPFAGLVKPAPPPPLAPLTSAAPAQHVPPVALDPLAGFASAPPAAAPLPPPPSGVSPASDPFSDLLAPSAPKSPAAGPPRDGPFASGQIPDDFDPFAAPPPKKATTGDPLRDLAGSAIDFSQVGATPAKSLVDFDPARKSDPRDPLQGGTPSLVDPQSAIDPLKLFGGDDRLVVDNVDPLGPGGRPMKDSLPEIGGNFVPPRVLPDPSLPRSPPPAAPAAPIPAARAAVPPPPAPRAPAPPAKAPPPPAAAHARTPSRHAARPDDETRAAPSLARPAPVPLESAANAQRLVAAFLEGAKAPNLGGNITPDLMHKLGEIVYTAVAGAMELMAARQITKREIGAEVTMIVASGNNPLKFLPTPEAAMMQILGPKMPGFMPASEAMEDAFDDLRAHEVGVIAGTRAAFAEVLRRFDPKRLEERLGKGGLLDSLMPGARKARLWDLFEARFNEIQSEAQDDFDLLFGQAFTKAYEDEVARQRGKRSRG